MNTFRKEIVFDRASGDYRAELDGELIGFYPNYHIAEVTLDQVVFDALIYSVTYDPPTPPPDPDPLPDPGPGGPGVPGDDRPHYTRDEAFDKRIGRGDDYASDAWRDQFGLLRWVTVGVDPNRS